MKTKVTETSITAFRKNQDVIRTQRQAVAEFILKESRAGRWTWIRKIADNADKIGFPALSQLSSASRALNELKRFGANLEGQEWVLWKGPSVKQPGCRSIVENWAMVLESSLKNQHDAQTEI